MDEALKYIKERIEDLEKAMNETDDKQFKRTYEDMIESFETVQTELEACVGNPSNREPANELLPHVSGLCCSAHKKQIECSWFRKNTEACKTCAYKVLV